MIINWQMDEVTTVGDGIVKWKAEKVRSSSLIGRLSRVNGGLYYYNFDIIWNAVLTRYLLFRTEVKRSMCLAYRPQGRLLEMVNFKLETKLFL